ncbi:unnamed protein product, partial [Musa acuminata subsp. burmannicoides]
AAPLRPAPPSSPRRAASGAISTPLAAHHCIVATQSTTVIFGDEARTSPPRFPIVELLHRDMQLYIILHRAKLLLQRRPHLPTTICTNTSFSLIIIVAIESYFAPTY